jgi:hypothetical protein
VRTVLLCYVCVYRAQGLAHRYGAYHPKAMVCIADTAALNLLNTDWVFPLKYFQKKAHL